MSRAIRQSVLLALLFVAGDLNPAIGRGEKARQAENDRPAAEASLVFGEKRTVTGVGNFGEVTPRLFRGAQPTEAGFRALAKMGVQIVVDARGDRGGSEGKRVHALGMQYVAIPWRCFCPHDEVFARFLKLLSDSPDKKVFVHCRQGDDRTGMMIAAYRMADEGWSAKDAMLEMQYFGFAGVHPYICPRLASYESSFPHRLKLSPAFQNLRSSLSTD